MTASAAAALSRQQSAITVSSSSSITTTSDTPTAAARPVGSKQAPWLGRNITGAASLNAASSSSHNAAAAATAAAVGKQPGGPILPAPRLQQQQQQVLNNLGPSLKGKERARKYDEIDPGHEYNDSGFVDTAPNPSTKRTKGATPVGSGSKEVR